VTVRVAVGGRLHFGFRNLSLARDRLYGSVGVGLASPETVVTADPAGGVTVEAVPDGVPAGAVASLADRAATLLAVPGAAVHVERALPRHVGLGSGTALALATLTAVGAANGVDPDVRALAPDLGRGGRSGVGVAAFEAGGLVFDAGQPSGRFTTGRPPDGDWSVPPVAARRPLPDDWRFVLARPDADPGRSGADEEAGMRSVVESADPAVADEATRVVAGRLLPAVAAGDLAAFGAAVERFNRLNGAWYADEQGGVYRPPVGAVVEALSSAPAVAGAGQSSWGPTVFGVTAADRADDARAAAREALATAGVDGTVSVVAPRAGGASVERA
jgi:beta-ribofuranosylaminobenzene 5'-phosphate synthase